MNSTNLVYFFWLIYIGYRLISRFFRKNKFPEHNELTEGIWYKNPQTQNKQTKKTHRHLLYQTSFHKEIHRLLPSKQCHHPGNWTALSTSNSISAKMYQFSKPEFYLFSSLKHNNQKVILVLKFFKMTEREQTQILSFHTLTTSLFLSGVS